MVEAFHREQRINLRILAPVGYCCHKPTGGNHKHITPRTSGTVLNSPRLKGAIQAIPRLAGKVRAGAGRGLLRFSATVTLEVSKAIARPTCPRKRTRLDLFPLSRARIGALNPEQLELPGGD